MFTPYRTAFCVNTKSYPVYYEQQRHRGGTSHSQTLNIVPEWLTKWLLFSKSQLFTLAQWISVLFPSYSLPLPSRHLFILHHSLAQNLSNMWWAPWPLFRMVSCSFTQFTTEIVGQTQHYVWKEALSGMIFVLVQWLSSVASVNIALKGWLRVNVKG